METIEDIPVFASTTAEISEAYIDKFPEKESVPNYLRNLSNKAGVELVTKNGNFKVKGTWRSVSRAHFFLGQFLLTYGHATVENISPQKTKAKPMPKSLPMPVNDVEIEDADLSFLNRKTFASYTAPMYVKRHKTPVQRDTPNKSKKFEKTKSPPDPLVLYGGFQASTEVETRQKTLEVLKNVYSMDQHFKPPKDAKSKDLSTTSKSENSHAYLGENLYDFRRKNNDTGTESKRSDGKIIEKIIEKKVLERLASENEKNKNQVETNEENTEVKTEDSSESQNLKSGASSEAPGDVSEDDTANESKDEESDVDNGDGGDDNYSVGADDLDDSEANDPVDLSQDDDKDWEEEHSVKKSKMIIPKKRKMKTRFAEKLEKEEDSLGDPSAPVKRGRGRPRKGTPQKLKVGLPVVKRKRGRPKRPHSDVPKEFHCTECPYFAHKRCHLREHQRRCHITKEFKCEDCGKIFGFGKDLNRHRRTHQKPQNCCDICGKLYKGAKSLSEHRRTHDEGYIKPEYSCELCDKSFSTKYVLAYHIKSEHLGMKRTYLCPTCGKSFSQKNSYVQHANVHMGLRPYKCEICSKTFSYEKSLKEHRFMHDDIRRFKCPVCDKTFRQSSAVTIHLKVHKETKDYVCMACGKGFSQKQALIRHERIHLGEKPFSCSLCGRNFTDSSILRRHMILIHKKDPKKWREDTVNNVVRRRDFFIDVVPDVDEDVDETSVAEDPEDDTFKGESSVEVATTPYSEQRMEQPINMSTQGQSHFYESHQHSETKKENSDQSQVQHHTLDHASRIEGRDYSHAAPSEVQDHSFEQATRSDIQDRSFEHASRPASHDHSFVGSTQPDGRDHSFESTNRPDIGNYPTLHQGHVEPRGHSVEPQGHLAEPPNHNEIQASSMDHRAHGFNQGDTGPGIMPYGMIPPGNYPYPSMIMMPDASSTYQTGAVSYNNTQYTEPTASHPFSSYPPPQS